jgi:hypothetical protein
MITKEGILPYFKKSILDDNSQAYTQDPLLATYSDDDLWDIVTNAVFEHNPLYTVDNFPVNEQPFLLMLCRKEIYFRLSTKEAPFYPIEAEGASLRKDYRFNHYITLIEKITNDYESAWEKFQRNTPAEAGEVILSNKHHTLRNYNLAEAPIVTAIVGIPTSTTADISWSKFDVFAGRFKQYKVYISTAPILDTFLNTISDSATQIAEINDIHVVKFRILNLQPNTKYYVLVASIDTNGLIGYSEVDFTTATA